MRRSDLRLKQEEEERLAAETVAEPRFDGRFFLPPDQRRYPCRTIDMSSEIVALRSDFRPTVGDKVTLDLDRWGCFEGSVIRRFDGGFTLDLELSDRPRAHVAMQFAWLTRHFAPNGAQYRSHERLRPKQRFTTFTVAQVILPCEILDLSRSGASLRTEVRVPPGEKVTIGKRTQAEVIRQTEDGFAVRFRRLLPLEIFDEDIEL
ncbi:PilZ domain-containing protein [Methylosinus sp. Ce-a6]|uniref:PilZ domain-containing protein n=1 Tax=Methylosinus sp. Ce-a6 TaxID=2172005 RepID=UPI001FCF0BC3|nr:PilZ domain-containing protein [Methylosinus sp. Ce-a6]